MLATLIHPLTYGVKEAQRRVRNAKSAYNSGMFSNPGRAGLYILATGENVPATGLDVTINPLGLKMSFNLTGVSTEYLSQVLWGEDPCEMPFLGLDRATKGELDSLNDGYVRHRKETPPRERVFTPQWSPAKVPLDELLAIVHRDHPQIARHYELVYPNLKTRFNINAVVPDFITNNPALKVVNDEEGERVRVVGAYKDTETVYRRCLEDDISVSGFVRYNQLYGDPITLAHLRSQAEHSALLSGMDIKVRRRLMEASEANIAE